MKWSIVNNTGRVLNNNWFITFSSTILGVIIGLFLSNYFNHQKLIDAKEHAFVQVKKEIENNFKNLKEYNDEIEVKYKSFQYLSSKLNDEMDIIIHRDSLRSFKTNLEGLVLVNIDQTKVADSDSLIINGNLNLELNSLLVISDLQTIIWNTYKETNYLSLTKFDCISDVETIYLLFEDFNTFNNQWRKRFFDANFLTSKQSLIIFLTEWGAVVQKQNLLIQYSEGKELVFEVCK